MNFNYSDPLPPATARQRLLDMASSIVGNDRPNEYGGPKESFQSIADFWNVYLKYKKSPEITAGDVAIMMDLVKTARLCANPKHIDSVVDKAGYSAVYAEVADIFFKE